MVLVYIHGCCERRRVVRGFGGVSGGASLLKRRKLGCERYRSEIKAKRQLLLRQYEIRQYGNTTTTTNTTKGNLLELLVGIWLLHQWKTAHNDRANLSQRAFVLMLWSLPLNFQPTKQRDMKYAELDSA